MMAQNDLANALADFDRAVALKPNYAPFHVTRGGARQLAGDFDGAVADYEQAIALAGSNELAAHFGQVHRDLLLRQLHRGDPTAELEQKATGWKSSRAKNIGLYLAGALSENDFLARAAKGQTKDVRSQQCEAYYFIGMIRLMAGDTNAAKEYFEKCVSTQLALHIDFALARAELARLTEKK